MAQTSRVLSLLAVAAVLALPAAGGAQSLPSSRDAVEHALNRLTFGPRPGDVEQVERMGLQRWIESQLTPEAGPEPLLEARLPLAPQRPPAFGSPQEARQWGRREVQDLAAAKLVRATYSERQLQEVLVDFWFNHFNVFAAKGRTALFLGQYERDVIRPHVFGKFRDLLTATAKSPAMLFYLDNRQSTVRGINENYARELLELHTLGVDAGYTQQDVSNVARVFTGWTIDPRTQQFRFARRQHDAASKTILGVTFQGGGIDEGERVLEMLARHPATARHLARKLATRLVSDAPPESLVDRAAARFQESDGDLRELTRAIVTSPEFFAASARGAKVKTPLEFVVSALRAANADLQLPRRWLRTLQQLGMPLYMCQPPTGYADTADAWLSAGAVVTRMNVARELGDTRFGLPGFQRR